MTSTAQAQADHRAERDEWLALAESRLDEFLNARQHNELISLDDGTTKTHHVILPSLWEQLELSVTPVPMGGRTGMGSSPVVNLSAIDVQQLIASEVSFWFTGILYDAVPGSTLAGMAQLIERAPTMTDGHLRGLESDTRRWWGMAFAITGWTEPPKIPHVPCMNCEQWDSLRMRTVPQLVVLCVACHEVWDDSTRGLLERYYRDIDTDSARPVDADTPEL